MPGISYIMQDTEQTVLLRKLLLSTLGCSLEEAVHYHGYVLYSNVPETEKVHVYGAVVDQNGFLVNQKDYVCWKQNKEVSKN